jgi:hypothetical protein
MAVAIIHMRAFLRLRWAEAETAITIVKLDDSSTRVITDEKTILGKNLNGVGQTFEARR